MNVTMIYNFRNNQLVGIVKSNKHLINYTIRLDLEQRWSKNLEILRNLKEYSWHFKRNFPDKRDYIIRETKLIDSIKNARGSCVDN